MTLIEIQKHINNATTREARILYMSARNELVASINEELAEVGDGPYTLRELLLMSPEPLLADTI